jgi:hypothetical protein
VVVVVVVAAAAVVVVAVVVLILVLVFAVCWCYWRWRWRWCWLMALAFVSLVLGVCASLVLVLHLVGGLLLLLLMVLVVLLLARVSRLACTWWVHRSVGLPPPPPLPLRLCNAPAASAVAELLTVADTHAVVHGDDSVAWQAGRQTGRRAGNPDQGSRGSPVMHARRHAPGSGNDAVRESAASQPAGCTLAAKHRPSAAVRWFNKGACSVTQDRHPLSPHHTGTQYTSHTHTDHHTCITMQGIVPKANSDDSGGGGDDDGDYSPEDA